MTPLTEEQLNQIGRETDHAARKAVEHYRRRALTGFIVLVLAFLASSVFLSREVDERAKQDNRISTAIVQSGNSVSVTGCNRDFITAQRLQAVLHVFQLPGRRLIALPDCREANNVTLNPDSATGVPPPEPLYKGSPNAPELPDLRLPKRFRER